MAKPGSRLQAAFIYMLISSVFTLNSDIYWKEWMQRFNKKYTSIQDEKYHRQIWNRHLDFMLSYGNSSFTMEMNHLADLDFKSLKKESFVFEIDSEQPQNPAFVNGSPSSFDWRQKGAVPPVHNQGQMGRSAPFVVTDCVESYEFIQTGVLKELSIQEVSDCCFKQSSLTDPFTCIHQLNGLCSAASYPLRVGGPCRNDTCTPVVQIKGGKSVPRGDENALKAAVLSNTVLVYIDASHTSFQLYRNGVYDELSCSSTKLDHSLLLVGYGVYEGIPFWLCKNSWGSSWGMQGYVMMSRNKHNQCGIATAASYPV